MTPDDEAVRTYLELTAPAQLQRASFSDPSIRVVRRDELAPDRFREIYRAVGWQWEWRDRFAWSDERLAAYLASPAVSFFECLAENDTAGFFELARHDDGSVEISYFGLVEKFFGRGLGKALLTRAAEEAWALNPTRVWLHTCTLDSPRALPNYLARGFRVFKTETFLKRLSDGRP